MTLKRIFLWRAFLPWLCWLAASCSDADGLLEAEADGSTDAAEEVYMRFVLYAVDGHGFSFTRASGDSSTTRAQGAYEAGTAAEYAVHEATLIFFSRNASAAESQSEFLYAATVQPVGGQEVTDNVEIDYADAVMLPADRFLNLPSGHSLLELFVVVNGGDAVWADGNGTLHVGAETFSHSSGGDNLTFARLSERTLTRIGSPDSEGGMLMTSAPLADKPGGKYSPTSSGVSTLVPVDRTMLAGSIKEAQSSPAAEAYVERAAAKVQLTTAIVTTIDADGKATTDDSLFTYTPADIRWDLAGENSRYYIARRVSTADLERHTDLTDRSAAAAANPYRFVDSRPVQTGVAKYRIYWGEDVNYGSDYGTPADLGIVPNYADGTQPATAFPHAVGDVAYTTENTIDVDNMWQDRTTCLLLSVPFHDGKDFYTLPKIDEEGVIYDQAGLEARLLAIAQGTAEWEAAELEPATISVKLTAADGKVTFTMECSDAGTETSAEDPLAAVAESVRQTVGDIRYYRDGLAYYRVPIQHFGDETPLLDTVTTASTYEGLYYGKDDLQRKARYLGRFGVVRDTYYQIEVSDVKRLGSPTIPTGTDRPDDDTEHLRLRIIILPWMEHEQTLAF